MLNFFKTRPDLPLLSSSKAEMLKRYKSYQWQVFIGLIFGYAMFYVVRMALGVVKKPMLDLASSPSKNSASWVRPSSLLMPLVSS